ncbi:MAG: hypothetical protein NTU74_11605 [Deltaproteobacteria bacterium]|nr:hypothetical protein [Deltaproteobacteria bacterium]
MKMTDPCTCHPDCCTPTAPAICENKSPFLLLPAAAQKDIPCCGGGSCC